MNKKNSSWKEGIQTFGRSLLLPIALLAPIGMVMGICSAMGQSYMIDKFPFLGNEIVRLIFSSLQSITSIIFNNISIYSAPSATSFKKRTKPCGKSGVVTKELQII